MKFHDRDHAKKDCDPTFNAALLTNQKEVFYVLGEFSSDRYFFSLDLKVQLRARAVLTKFLFFFHNVSLATIPETCGYARLNRYRTHTSISRSWIVTISLRFYVVISGSKKQFLVNNRCLYWQWTSGLSGHTGF